MARELKNGLYHAGWAIFVLLPIPLIGGVFGYTLAGLLAGMIREVTEEGTPVTAESIFDAMFSWRDLLGWTIGGLVLGSAIQLVA